MWFALPESGACPLVTIFIIDQVVCSEKTTTLPSSIILDLLPLVAVFAVLTFCQCAVKRH